MVELEKKPTMNPIKGRPIDERIFDVIVLTARPVLASGIRAASGLGR